MKDLTVVVMGANGGIGGLLVERFVSEGARVVGTDLDPKPKLKWDVGRFRYVSVDITKEKQTNQLFAKVARLYGAPQVVINCAGVGVFKSLTEISSAEWDRVLATNLTGAFLCAKFSISSMLRHGGGRLINIGSVADSRGLVGNAAYGASKAGLRNLGAVINAEYGPNNVTATHVALGAVYTPIWQGRKGFSKKDMLRAGPVIDTIYAIATLPFDVRVEHIEILPKKGVL